MKLILKQPVENLGDIGDIVQVKPGYGRNYLIPQGLAYPATPANVARLEEERAKAEERAKRDRLEAKRRASQLEGLSLTFTERASDEGKLFGSVSPADIVSRINETDIDFELERRALRLDEPIKEVGVYEVPVKLHPEVEVTVEVRVERVED